MDKDHKSRDAQQQVIDLFRENPDAARSTSKVTARIEDGLRCRVVEGDHSIAMDLPPAVGGENSAPGPGVFARAALAGCIVQVLKMTAIRKEVELRDIQLELEVDFDDRAMFGFGDKASSILQSRITLRVDCDLTDEDLQALVNESLEMDPYFLVWRDQQLIAVTAEKLLRA